jgi:predicted  nucleic acid-binding Zn-ribbon protein
MNSVTTFLVELQSLEERLEKRLPAAQREEAAAQVAKIRGQVPITVLGHYDRMKTTGKKPMAAVRNGACQGCFLSLPYGDILRMKTSDDIHLCEHCGRYIYLSEESPAEEEPAPASAKSKSRKSAAASAKPRAKRKAK